MNNNKVNTSLAYIRAEYSNQTTFFSMIKTAFVLSAVSAYTKKWFIFIFALILLFGGIIQYTYMSHILMKINKSSTEKNIFLNKDLYKMRDINKNLFIFYVLLFIIAMYYQFKHI